MQESFQMQIANDTSRKFETGISSDLSNFIYILWNIIFIRTERRTKRGKFKNLHKDC